MKILSNFNTNLEEELKTEYELQFGVGKVMTVHKSRLFYWRFIGLPLVVYTSLLIISFYFFFREEALEQWMIWSYIGFFLFYGLVIFLRVGSEWVNYKMDFLLVTPKEITKYNQSGVFDRQIEKIHADKVKSVSISKPGFRNSVFDIGSISFMAEGDNEKGDIVMEYIDAVEAQERNIMHVLGMDKE